MSELQHFQILDGYAECRLSGEMSLSHCIHLVTVAIGYAREQQQQNLLVVLCELEGFRSPDIAARYFFIKDWAQTAGGIVRLALVARPEMIDPQKFGVTVAANNGLISDIFVSEEEALVWFKSLVSGARQ